MWAQDLHSEARRVERVSRRLSPQEPPQQRA